MQDLEDDGRSGRPRVPDDKRAIIDSQGFERPLSRHRSAKFPEVDGLDILLCHTATLIYLHRVPEYRTMRWGLRVNRRWENAVKFNDCALPTGRADADGTMSGTSVRCEKKSAAQC